MMMTPLQFQRISGESWAEHDPWAPLHTDCKPPSSKKIPSEIYGGSTALYAADIVDTDFTVDMVWKEFNRDQIFDNLFHDLPKTSLESWLFLFTGSIWAPGNSAGFWAKELESNPCCWKHDAVPPGDHVGDDDGDDGGVSSSDHGMSNVEICPTRLWSIF